MPSAITWQPTRAGKMAQARDHRLAGEVPVHVTDEAEIGLQELAREVDDDHRVGRLLDHGDQLPELSLRRLAHADVADGGRDQDPLGALEWAQHDLDRELGAVPAARGELDPRPDLLGHGIVRGA
jgi:hypothetical protein